MRDIAAEQNEKLKGARAWRILDSVVYFAFVLMIALAVRSFVVEPIRVEGTSMIPTLEDKEHMFVDKLAFWTRMPERGEIIICYYPGYKESCVKRVMALPGETISIIKGEIWINGEKLDESEYWNDEIWNDYEGITVGPNEIFVMGDNRNGSKDSRNASVGCIPMGRVVGRVRAVIWPVSRFRLIKKAEYK